jgi:hypothetical protein
VLWQKMQEGQGNVCKSREFEGYNNIIFDLRVVFRYYSYIHHKILANKEIWKEVQEFL